VLKHFSKKLVKIINPYSGASFDPSKTRLYVDSKVLLIANGNTLKATYLNQLFD
jgi:hypothetical protein